MARIGFPVRGFTSAGDDDAGRQRQLRAQAGETVNQDGTGTSLVVSPGPASYGQAVTLTATVSAAAPGAGTPTGTVDFFDQSTGTDLGTATLTLVNGQEVATLTTTSLAVGSHTITATYAGDGNFGSSSGQASEAVGQDGTSATVEISPNPGAYGQALTLTATGLAVGRHLSTP